jgi:hypothetical protein
MHSADASTLRRWDGVALFWVVLWLVVGCWSGVQIHQLTGLADSTVSSGRALATAGQALSTLAEVPVIGETTGRLGDEVSQTAEDITAGGERAGRSVRVLGVLVGLSIALGPVGPVLLLYLPLRMAQRRQTRDVVAALRAGHGTGLSAQLAHRAVSHLSPSELSTVSDDPVGDLLAGRYEQLAAAELRRLGIDRPVRS